MTRFALACGLSLAIPATAYLSADAQPIQHHIKVSVVPEEHRIQVEDSIALPETLLAASGREVTFVLHAGLQVASSVPSVRPGPDQEQAKINRVSHTRFTVRLPPGERTFVIAYHGEIRHPLEPQSERYARAFSDTPGMISSDGMYLAGESSWYPQFDQDLLLFTLDVDVPTGWDVVSQGDRTRHARKNGRLNVRWESRKPQDEIFLIGGPFTEYSRASGQVLIMAFLRTPDRALATKYLEATTRYLEIYGTLIGPYPYAKFALVENFWETGYGMPSFTLLGPKVIRLPFILHSSYPHEILHNWWGNGVFVDYETGNWSEGLTAYLADHLIKEQHGAAVEFRRETLQKYTDYVSKVKDFPLTAFRARSSSVTEAVGYGKMLMFFHMLRVRLGDEVFTEGLRNFYRENQFRRANFSDLQSAFSAVAGDDLELDFAQWITRPGAPALRISEAKARPEGKEYLLTAIVEQTQSGPAYVLHIPIAVHVQGQEIAIQRTVAMESKHMELALRLPGRPWLLDVDPEFDIFRRLGHSEIPPALTQAFGADTGLILVPAKAADKVRQAYRRFAEELQRSLTGHLDVKWDSDIDQLPADRAVWILGWENRFHPEIAAALADYDVMVTQSELRIGTQEIRRENHSAVLSARRPENPDLALIWVASDNASAMRGLARKLPHYRKYSYLGFEGNEPTNIAKGQWPIVHSPMSILITQPDGSVITDLKGKLAPRRALASLPASP